MFDDESVNDGIPSINEPGLSSFRVEVDACPSTGNQGLYLNQSIKAEILQGAFVPGPICVRFCTMASALTWMETLAGFKALYDLLKFGSDYSASYLKYRNAPDTVAEARRVSGIFSTHSGEMEALIGNIEECRDRFISQRSGKDQTRCLCGIFDAIRAANGGRVPLIDDWQLMYDELGCGSGD